MFVLRRLLCTRALQLRTEVGGGLAKPTSELSFDDEPRQSLLAPENEDLSYVGRSVPPVFNFAYFVDRSPNLQQLVRLGVDLYRIEQNPTIAQEFIKFDFDRDIKSRLVFLNDYVEPSELGKFITKNPLIFKEDLDDLQTRINYLRSKRFTVDMIKRIVSADPLWLNYSTRDIDKRLGYFQKKYFLKGDDVRYLTTKRPRLITYDIAKIEKCHFSLTEEMGFSKHQIRQLLLDKPKIWMTNNQSLIRTFNYLHEKMKISHDYICRMPEVLTCRSQRIKQRHEFLKRLGRDEYRCTVPNYVSLKSLVEGSDAEFCLNVAKCGVAEYNLYLKSL